MKKLFTSMLFIMAFTTIVNATTYYVDGSKTDDTGNGQSWATSKQTFSAASALATTPGDNIFVKAGIYSYTKTTAGAGGAFIVPLNVNIYGGFSGTESSPSERATSDLDGNGIVEPWEFTNQTVLDFTLTNGATGITTSNLITQVSAFNGFKITGSSSFPTTVTTSYCISIGKYTKFENNTVSDWVLTGDMGVNSLTGCPFFNFSSTGNNVINNCLFEKNIVTLNATSTLITDKPLNPFIYLVATSADGRTVMSNCIVRNNQVKIDNTNTGATSFNNQRGLIISIPTTTTGFPTTLKNTIVHNNEVTCIPKATTTTPLGYGSIVYTANTTTSVSDSILNCTIANNKMVKCSGTALRVMMDITAFLNPTHIVLNNAIYNNTNDGVVSNFASNSAGVGGIPATTVAKVKNNYTNGGVTNITNNSTNVANNIFDVSDTNTDATKGANFSNPTSSLLIGSNRIAGSADSIAIAKSRWTIGAKSYLKGKGITTLTPRDKVDHLYATPPSVGAYEYASYIVTVNKNSTGSTSAVTGAGTYDYGTPVTVSATPHKGILFTNWTDGTGIKSTKASYTFYPTANYTITGNFDIDPSTGISKTETVDFLIVNGRSIKSTIEGSIEVYNSLGKLVATSSKNESTVTLNNGGIYIVKNYTANENKVQKIFVK